MIYWMSWWDTDCRPKSNPSHGDPSGPGCQEILGYWESGVRYAEDGYEVSVCALIRADSVEAAWAIVNGEWEPREARFCEPSDGRLNDRFRPAPWMRARLGVLR